MASAILNSVRTVGLPLLYEIILSGVTPSRAATSREVKWCAFIARRMLKTCSHIFVFGCKDKVLFLFSKEKGKKNEVGVKFGVGRVGVCCEVIGRNTYLCTIKTSTIWQYR